MTWMTFFLNLVKNKLNDQNETSHMLKKNIEAIYRLSPLQEGILFHGLENPNSDVYFQQFSCKIQGIVDSQLWQQCWAEIAKRHGALRTLFTWEKRDQPLQIVRERVSLPWQIFDWSGLTEADQASKWQSVLQRDRDLGFELSKAPLVRFALAEIGDGQVLFLFSFHHILLDGWSQRLLLEEAMTGYQDNHQPPTTITKAPPYSDFIDWIYSQDNATAKQFWTAHLADFKQATYIANHQPAIDQQSHGKQVIELGLDNDHLLRLKDTAKQNRITLNTIVLGAWAKILASECQVNDLVFGTTVAGRPANLTNADKMAGLFINTLPLRVKVSADANMQQWLKNIQSHQASCREFEQTALPDIQKYAGTANGQALFDSIIVFENLPAQGHSSTAKGLSISDAAYAEFSHYPLAILVDPSDGLNLIAVHQTHKISSAKVKVLLEKLQILLIQMSQSLSLPVKQYSALTDSERQLTLVDWNESQGKMPHTQCIHQDIEKWAELTPDKNALTFCHKPSGLVTHLSYQLLNQQANQLARHILAQGVSRQHLVVVLLARSIESIVAFLAILKAGAAYVPIDSANPSERINTITNSFAGQRYFVVSTKDLANKIPAGAAASILIDQQNHHISQQDKHNLDLAVKMSDLAYVIFTSGSTGQPKGVMIEHASLSYSTLARTEYYLHQPEVFLLLSPFTTDSSIAGIYWALSTGHCLVIADKHAEQDMHGLLQLIVNNQVSHILCIPSLYQLMLEYSAAQHLSSVNTVIVAGESCKAAVVRSHQRKMQDSDFTAQLYNEYGPSEATVWATVACLTHHQSHTPVPIGKAITNTQLYVLDKDLMPVSIGQTGELYIGGLGLARGYLHQPSKTAEVFRDIELSMPSGVAEFFRLYKTGDLVRYLTNGSLEFIGRADNQMKIRGLRVEPEEIENIISTHPSVEEAAVYIQTDRGNSLNTMADQLAQMAPDQAQAILKRISTSGSSQQGTS
jgi:amino acid adenylation domain-containing protein